jgi:hypothetical protein
MIKNEVVAKIREYLTLFKFKVWSFGDNRALRHGAKDFVDLVAAARNGKIIFIEVKTKATNDKLSEGQKDTALILGFCANVNRRVYYRVLDEDNYKDEIIAILED